VRIDRSGVPAVEEPLGPRSLGPFYAAHHWLWLHAGDVDGVALCRMFNTAISTKCAPKYISSDNDPLFLYQQWQANLRILSVDESTVKLTVKSKIIRTNGLFPVQ